jgi:hypothetical protein
MSNPKTPDHAAGTTPRQQENYDPHITPAETAARMEREGEKYKHIPNESDRNQTEPQVNSDSIHTTDGYTTDKEGLIDNFATEPEMYYEQPGDAKAQEEEEQARRAQELEDVNDNEEEGKLGMGKDERGRGPGVI